MDAIETPSACEEIPSRRTMAVIGCILLTGPLHGLIGTVVGMSRAYSKLAATSSADPSALAGDISIALLTTLYGAVFGLIGALLVSLVLYRGHNRERWFYRSVITLSVVWCIMLFPIGLIVGIYLIVIFRARRSEFSSRVEKLADAPSSGGKRPV